MALIVKIAEDLGSSLEETVQGARRLLVRERRLLPAGRLDEVDRACLQWYIRQPGSDGAQKAAANRQRLLGVSRQETFDTLENRVLKDFMHRTAQEGRRYLLFDCEPGQRHSKRAKKVGSFRTLCDALAKLPHLASVPFQRGMPQPNYVLQNDPRYKKIWKWYIRLLKQEDEADSLWTWQNRTWDDIAALLLQAATVRLARNTRGNIVLEPLGNSTLRLLREQRLGRRLEAGSEPGPFLVRLGNAPFETGHIMEFVHSSQLNEHPAFRQFQEETYGKTAAIQPLARLGAAHFVLLSPLDPRGGGTTLIPVWGVHTAASSDRFSFTEIAASASRALEAHDNAIYGRAQNPPHVHGLALCSTLDERIARTDEENIHAAMLGAAPETWKTNLDLLETLLEDLLKGLL